MAKEKNEPPKFPQIGERLSHFVKHSGEPSARQFAIKAGITPAVLSNLMLGYSMPGGETLASIADAFRDFDATWLLTGNSSRPIGPPSIKTETADNAVAATQSNELAEPTDLAKMPERVRQVVETPTAETPQLWINKEGAIEGGPAALVAELRGRLADKDLEIERLVDQLAAWQEAYRKPLASSYAAASTLPSPCRPIGPRFDEPEPTMFVSYRQAAA